MNVVADRVEDAVRQLGGSRLEERSDEPIRVATRGWGHAGRSLDLFGVRASASRAARSAADA